MFDVSMAELIAPGPSQSTPSQRESQPPPPAPVAPRPSPAQSAGEKDLQSELRRLRRQSENDVLAVLVAIVYNTDDEVVPDVLVSVHGEGKACTDTPPLLSMMSSSSGVAVFRNMAAGRYRICANSPPTPEGRAGYDSEPADVVLNLSRITGVEVRVRVRATENVEVSSSSIPAHLRASSTLEAIFSHEIIANAPLSHGRTLQSLVTLMPGITMTESTGTLGQFTAVGQRRFANRLTIDGISADLAVALNPLELLGIGSAGSGALPAYSTSGSTLTLVPVGAIQEVQIRTANVPSEHARTAGAQTSVVTRAGGDRHTGSTFLNGRPRGLAAKDWFDNASGLPLRRPALLEAGAAFGGPARQHRLYYFGTWEQQHIDRTKNATILVPSLPVREAAPETVRQLLGAFPVPNGPEVPDAEGLAEFSHQAAVVSDLSVLSMRVDANVSARHRLFARASRGMSSGDSLLGTGLPVRKTPPMTYTQEESTSTTTATIGMETTWSDSTHSLRANVTLHNGSFDLGPSSYGGAGVLPLSRFVPAGVSEGDIWVGLTPVLGGTFLQAGRGFEKTQRQVQLVDTWSLLRGRHEWRLGLDYRRVVPQTRAPRYVYNYTFGSVDNLMASRLRSVLMLQTLPSRARIETWSAFIQDRFRLSSRLSLDYGLRYSVKPAPSTQTNVQPLLISFDTLPDIRSLPEGSRLWKTSWTDFAPRVGVSYQLGTTPGRGTTLRTGWSLVFDELTTPGASVFGRAYPYVTSRFVQSDVFPVPASELAVQPNVPFGETANGEAYSFASDLRTPRTHEWQVGIEQELGKTQRLAISYVGTAGRELVYWHAYQIEGSSGAQTVHAYSNAAQSDYHVLLVDYEQRPWRGFQGGIAYSWSHAIDIDSGENVYPHAPPSVISPSSNRASADFDRRHVLRVTASFSPFSPRMRKRLGLLLSDWQIDVVGTVQSGTPSTVLVNRDLEFGNFVLRPDVVPDVPVWIADGSAPTGWRVNPDAFRAPEDARQGSLGRNTLRAPELRQVDVSLSRSVRIGTGAAVQLRLSAFNVLNTANFGPRIGQLEMPNEFGRPYESYADAMGSGTLTQGGLVPLQQFGGPRAVQFDIRLAW